MLMLLSFVAFLLLLLLLLFGIAVSAEPYEDQGVGVKRR